MSRGLNIAVVGLGMGIHHCAAIQRGKGIRLAGVCDTDPARVKNAVEHFGAKAYSRYADVLKDPAIDAVSIVTESGKHAEMGIQAARAGKHIVMEKPLDITPARMRKFADVVKAEGVKCACIFQHRMNPFHVQARKAIQKGQFGNLIGVHAHLPWLRVDSYYEGPHGAWHGTWKLDGGGSLMNQGIHTLDLAIDLAGPVKDVAAFFDVHSHNIESEDQTVAILRFKSGALGTFYSTTCHIPESAQRLHVYGTKGSFSRFGTTLEYYHAGSAKERERMMAAFGGQKKADAAGANPMAISADGHQLIFEDLAKAIRADREPVVTVESAMYSVNVACAIYESARKRRVVKVDSVCK